MNIIRVMFALVAGLIFSAPVFAEVTIEKSDRGAVVKIDGKLFTEYLTKAGHEPALYPVIGPTGTPMTRSYPFTPPGKDGTKDHPHHHSLWMTHGEVNGIDFWASNVNNDKGDKGPNILHREFVKVAGAGDKAEIVTRNDWMNGDKRICDDERTLVFGNEPDGSRWIDFAITIHANDGDVTFGDTKEGSFAIRVADSMRVDAKAGGHIVNSEKQSNAAAWGQPSRWVDYTGPVEGETAGIAIMSHPKSYQSTPRWHVRTYGLFAANPFGEKDFPNPEAADQGAITVKKGDSLTLKYRVWLHKGATDVEALERQYQDFASQ